MAWAWWCCLEERRQGEACWQTRLADPGPDMEASIDSIKAQQGSAVWFPRCAFRSCRLHDAIFMRTTGDGLGPSIAPLSLVPSLGEHTTIVE
jgi:hypothetical protein